MLITVQISDPALNPQLLQLAVETQQFNRRVLNSSWLAINFRCIYIIQYCANHNLEVSFICAMCALAEEKQFKHVCLPIS